MLPEILTAVVVASNVMGWPHAPTASERVQVLDAVAVAHFPKAVKDLRASCNFGARMGSTVCGVVVRFKHKPQRRVAFRVRVQVWEDGSYNFAYAPNSPWLRYTDAIGD